MRTEINFSTENGMHYDVILTGKLLGVTSQFMKGGDNYKYKITVSVNGKTEWFHFHTSMSDYNKGKNALDHADFQNALYCFLSDATSGDMDAFEFMSEFGYTDPKEAKRIYDACVKAKEKAERLFNDIYEAANAVQELENA